MSLEWIDAVTVAICLSLLSSTRPSSTAGPVVSRFCLSASEMGRRTMRGTNVLVGYRWAIVKPVVPGSGSESAEPEEESSPQAASANSAPAPASKWRRDINIGASVRVVLPGQTSRTDLAGQTGAYDARMSKPLGPYTPVVR